MTLAQLTELDDEMCTWPSSPQLFTRANALDQWPLPITPLTQDLVELPQERGLEAAFATVLRVAEPSPPWTWNACFYGYVMFGVSPAAALADNLPGWNRAGVYSDYLGVRPDPSAPAESKQAVNPMKLARIGAGFARALRGYPRRANAEIRSARVLLDADRARDWSEVDDDYLIERIKSFPALHVRQREPHAVASVVSAALFKQLNTFVAAVVGDEELGSRLTREMITPLGGVHMRDAIEAMADLRHGRLSRDEFMRSYGFRGANEFELAARPWEDDPETVDRMVGASSRQATGDTDAREAARHRVQATAGLRWRPLSSFLRLTETHLRWRENGKLPMVMGTAAIRLVVRETGRRLSAAGALRDPDDVCYLRSAELVAALGGNIDDVAERADKRRKNRLRAMSFTLPEIVDAGPQGLTEVSEARWHSLGLEPPAKFSDTATVLTGVGGSHGVVTGRARIVGDPTDVDVEDGDILVVCGTDSAWTPLFLQADAVVVDIGGVMSHACIAAREVGIPCVIDVKNGTTCIREGQRITVDGDAGIVTLL